MKALRILLHTSAGRALTATALVSLIMAALNPQMHRLPVPVGVPLVLLGGPQAGIALCVCRGGDFPYLVGTTTLALVLAYLFARGARARQAWLCSLAVVLWLYCGFFWLVGISY